MSQYNGDPSQGHERWGQSKSADDAVTGKARSAIAEPAFCEISYRDEFKTRER